MNRAFTIIEILVSVAILALIVVLGAGIVGSASGVSRATIQRTALREDARSVFDRMALDFSSAVRFDTYQFETTSGTDSVLSLLSRASQSDSTRLRRIDYQVATNGLFRSVREVGWNESQDLAAVQAGTGELLAPSVGRMVAQALLNDGTTQTAMTNPSVRTNPRPVGVRVALVLADAGLRKSRELTPPALDVTNTIPWVSLNPDDERKGWRISEKIFRLP